MVIYKIENLENGKVYIGQTRNSFTKRWQQHKMTLNKNYHFNRHLQRSWNKYTEAAFQFSVLESCDTLEQLDLLEIYYIKKYESYNHKFGFNKQYGGVLTKEYTKEIKLKMSILSSGENNGFYGKKHTKKTKDLIGLKNKGKIPKNKGVRKERPKLVKSPSKVFKKVLAKHLVNNTEICFKSLKAASVYLNCSIGNISSVCSGRLPHTKNWKFVTI